jgi:hypothetical protein
MADFSDRVLAVSWAVELVATIGGATAIGTPVGFVTGLWLRASGKVRLRWGDSTVPIDPKEFAAYGGLTGGAIGLAFALVRALL